MPFKPSTGSATLVQVGCGGAFFLGAESNSSLKITWFNEGDDLQHGKPICSCGFKLVARLMCDH